MTINGKNFLTIREMADILKLKPNTVKQRLFQAQIKPVSKDAIYEESALEVIREAPLGRPPKGSKEEDSIEKAAAKPENEPSEKTK